MADKNVLRPVLQKYIEVSEEELDAICECIEISSFDKKVRVTDIGNQENSIYWVVRGLLIKYFYNGKDEVVTEIATKGDIIFSFISFFNQKPSGCIVETVELSILYSLSRQDIEQLCEKYPRLQKLYSILLAQALIKADQHNRDKIIHTTKELFTQFMTENRDILLRMSQKHLASYLNMKPETFSRLKNTLKGIPQKKYIRDNAIEV